MPADWVRQLYQAALAANSSMLYNLIGEITENHMVLAQTLRTWVQGFRCDKIVDLVEQVRDSDHGTAETDHSDRG
jgi:hypothetical protein